MELLRSNLPHVRIPGPTNRVYKHECCVSFDTQVVTFHLVLHMRKFVLEEGWVPKKLDVYIDVPHIIDLSFIRSIGYQTGEELLTEADDEDMPPPEADETIVTQLTSLGFSHLRCEKAVINTNNVGVEEAMNWLFAHMDDPDIDAPISGKESSSSGDQSKLETMVSFGFPVELARKARKESGNDIEKASNWIFDHPEASGNDPALPDGGGKYKLLGIVSHIGTSTHCGYYVAHIKKDGRWVIFNDLKVGVSKNPPLDMGYLYFFERLD